MATQGAHGGSGAPGLTMQNLPIFTAFSGLAEKLYTVGPTLRYAFFAIGRSQCRARRPHYQWNIRGLLHLTYGAASWN